MLNLKILLQKQIGNRIKFYRKNVKRLKQEEFSIQYQMNYGYMEVSILSSIERGKIKGKNVSYLTNAQLNDFSNFMGCGVRELVFGNEEERENLVKLILLGIIMNGCRSHREDKLLNPIIDTKEHLKDAEEYLRVAMLNIIDPSLEEEITKAYFNLEAEDSNIDLRKLVKDCNEWYEINYGFFADPLNYNYMDTMLTCWDKKLNKGSNLLISLLFGNVHFATDFISGIEAISNQKDDQKKKIDQFRNYEGQFGDIAIDWKEVGYGKFVQAFNDMWERNSLFLMNYFNDKLFNQVTVESSLKELDNLFFEKVIASSEFNDLLYTLINGEKFNLKTMVGHNIVLLSLQSMFIESEIKVTERYREGYNIFKYNYDVKQVTQSFINEMASDEDVFLFLK